MTAPDSIWYNGTTQHSHELRHNQPTSDIHPKIEYVRVDLVRVPLAEALAVPEVAALVEAAMNYYAHQNTNSRGNLVPTQSGPAVALVAALRAIGERADG